MSYDKEEVKGFIKKEKPLIVSNENQPYIDSFLFESKKRSDKTHNLVKVSLKKFFSIIDKPIKEINLIDVRNYFIDYLDKEEISLKSKEVYRSMLHSFFSHVQALFLSQNILYQNPIPSKKIFQFTQFEKDVKKQSEKDLNILKKNSIFKILDFCYKNRKLQDFVLIGLTVCTGGRISEIFTIRIDDINLNDRYFETGFVKNARKTTLKREESLLFFFPERFKIFLKNYILSLKTLKSKTKWLFPNIKGDNHGSLTKPYYLLRVLRQKLGIKFSFHYFRRTLITERVKMGCPNWVSEGLMNHKGSSVEIRHYIKLSIPEKRKLYDQYFPYYSFPYF